MNTSALWDSSCRTPDAPLSVHFGTGAQLRHVLKCGCKLLHTCCLLPQVRKAREWVQGASIWLSIHTPASTSFKQARECLVAKKLRALVRRD